MNLPVQRLPENTVAGAAPAVPGEAPGLRPCSDQSQRARGSGTAAPSAWQSHGGDTVFTSRPWQGLPWLRSPWCAGVSKDNGKEGRPGQSWLGRFEFRQSREADGVGQGEAGSPECRCALENAPHRLPPCPSQRPYQLFELNYLPAFLGWLVGLPACFVFSALCSHRRPPQSLPSVQREGRSHPQKTIHGGVKSEALGLSRREPAAL